MSYRGNVLKNSLHFVLYAGDGGWRALAVCPRELQYHWPEARVLHLAFTLPRGSYATALLPSIFDLHDASNAHE